MYYTGISEPLQVFEWVEFFLKDKRYKPCEEGMSWLKEELVEKKEGLIADILLEFQKGVKTELTDYDSS